ncbi:MAG TPA: hypothetical protein VLB68_07630 [Pyrinomonadaceae bacterium]|nr:hypothetical protein [Pyrinomonadaceae bacterium]
MSSISKEMTPFLEDGVLISPEKSRPALVQNTRVVILCSTLWSIRNVVFSGLLERLRARGVKPLILIGRNFDRVLPSTLLAAECHSPIQDAPIVRPTRGKPLLDALLYASFARRFQISSYSIFNRWFRQNKKRSERLKDVGVEWLSRLGCKDSFYYWQIDNLDKFLRRTRDFSGIKEQLKALDPTIVISTNCTEGTECQYVRACNDLDIATLNWVLSFDNLTSRGCLPLFDFYAVWNERMKAQVLQLYPERKPTDVYITGTTQFDFHVRNEFRWSREKTLSRLGLRCGQRYVLYAANSVIWTPSEPQLVEALSRRLADCAQLREHAMVVRLHPLDEYSRWQDLEDQSRGIVVNKPWRQDGEGFGLEDQALLVNSLLHADACINMASTISLDAAVLDTPVICVAFGGKRSPVEDRFYQEVYQTEHYRPLVESGGLRLAHNMDQLLAEIVSYSQNPERDASHRQKLAQDEVGPVDGGASERIASLVARVSRETLLRKAALT